ncbi:MAG: VWA domain-containing protein [Halothiobacillus sp.]|nr:VWA domain-containing protein [Halothiobacillus sp.]
MKFSDLIENPSPRCACLLVLDTSSSMSGAPIDELNEGLRTFIHELQKDEVAAFSVELAIIEFGAQVREVLPFTTVAGLDNVPSLEANGMTPMGSAVELALQKLEERKESYKRAGVAYYQPWMVLISDGAPNDAWSQAAVQAKTLASTRKLVSLPIGVQGADLSVLGEFSNKPAVPLSGLKFHEFFVWLSASMSQVSASNSTTAGVALPAMDSWGSI